MALESWVPGVTAECDFPLEKIPFGVAEKDGKSRCVTAVGDYVEDLQALAEAGLVPNPASCFYRSDLSIFMSLGRPVWTEVRLSLQYLFSAEEASLRDDSELKS
eukprot:EC849812.1.p1 GENE.EC849812.1~~EC849812.1.p1  ORF type:complete len:104 (+),score=24.70 EC849812.1:35-346(+)